MLYENAAFMWLALFLILFWCELFVPYRQKTALSFMMGCVACIVFCEYEKSLFFQCLFFLIFSFLVFVFALAVTTAAEKKKNVHTDKLAEVIALCDIPTKEYGAVYHSGKSHIIKNDSGRFLKKGETLQISRQELEDDIDV